MQEMNYIRCVNIVPTEYDTSSCKEYKKLLELLCRNEEKLKATFDFFV